jgi:hypothetical protein
MLNEAYFHWPLSPRRAQNAFAALLAEKGAQALANTLQLLLLFGLAASVIFYNCDSIW